jgi:hypothetical protein
MTFARDCCERTMSGGSGPVQQPTMALFAKGNNLRPRQWRFDCGHKDQRTTSTERLPFTQWADIQRTERFISVEPMSGYRMVQPEDKEYVIYLRPDATDEAMGRTLLESLERSRFIWPRDEPEFFKWERYERCYSDRQKDFMRRYGYKTKHDAYQNMNWCRAKRSQGHISIQPHKRDKPEYWCNLPPEKTVVIPTTDDAATVGAALRLALDRCE